MVFNNTGICKNGFPIDGLNSFRNDSGWVKLAMPTPLSKFVLMCQKSWRCGNGIG